MDEYLHPYMRPDLGKPSVCDYFQKIEFDVWLISPTIELTCIPPPTIEKLRSKGVVAMHAYDISVRKIKFDVWLMSPSIELTRAPPPTIEKLLSKGVAMHAYPGSQMDLGGAIRNERKDGVRSQF